jgi:hypothetical protein
MRIVGDDEFDRLFATIERSAYRLETLDFYDVPVEREAYRRFLAGEDPGTDWFEPWLNIIRSAVAAGRRFERVRVAREPLSDYLRFELWASQYNVEVGEDMRYLDIHRAAELGLPGYDYWLFDDDRLVRMYFNDGGRMERAEIITDLAAVEEHRQYRRRAWAEAVPYARYAAIHPHGL